MNLKVKGINLTFCTDEGNLWWDSDKHRDNKDILPPKWFDFGIIFALRSGWVLRPVKKFWLSRQGNNPWVSGNHWFVLKFWFPILPFFSIALGQKGLYLGFKTYGVDWTKKKNTKENYTTWLDPKYIKDGNKALALSASIRRTRI